MAGFLCIGNTVFCLWSLGLFILRQASVLVWLQMQSLNISACFEHQTEHFPNQKSIRNWHCLIEEFYHGVGMLFSLTVGRRASLLTWGLERATAEAGSVTMRIHQQLTLWQTGRSPEEGVCNLETAALTAELVCGLCKGRFIPSPALCRVPSHRSSTFGQSVEERFAPNASTTSFRALRVFTRDKLNNSHSVQAHQHPLLPAGAPGTAGKDIPKAARCARHPLISQGFKSEKNTQAFACWCFLPIQIWSCRMRAQEPWSHQALQNLCSEKLAFDQQAALAYPG